MERQGIIITIQQRPRLFSRTCDGSIRTAAKLDICLLRNGQRLDSSCKVLTDHQKAAGLYPNRTGVSGFLSFAFLSEFQPLAAGHHDCALATDGVAFRVEEDDVLDERHILRQGIVRHQGHIINALACQGIGQMLVIDAVRLRRELGAAGFAHAVLADFVGADKMTDGAFAVLPFVVSVFPSAGTFARLPIMFFVVGQYVKAGRRNNCLCAGIHNTVVVVLFQGFPLRDCRQPGASLAVQGAERPALK